MNREFFTCTANAVRLIVCAAAISHTNIFQFSSKIDCEFFKVDKIHKIRIV